MWVLCCSGVLDSLILAMKESGHLPEAFTIPRPPPKPSEISGVRYVQIMGECGVEGF